MRPSRPMRPTRAPGAPRHESERRRTATLASKLLGSSLLAQGAALVATAVAATQAQPTDFAVYAQVVAASAVISSFASLAVETRIPVLPDETWQGLNRAGATSAGALAVFIITVGSIAVLVGAPWGATAALIGLASAHVSVVGLLSAVVIRLQHQHLLARYRLVQGFSNALLVSGLIFTPIPGYLALTGSWISSMLLGILVVAAPIRARLSGFALAKAGDWRLALGQVRQQPLNNVLASLGINLPALVLPALGAMTLAGIWALISRILNAVVATIFATISPIYNGHAAMLIRTGLRDDLGRYHSRWMLRLALLPPCMVAGILVGVLYLVPLLGPQWSEAHRVLIPAMLGFASMVLWLPLSQTLVLLGRTGWELAWTVGNLVLTATPLLLGRVIGPDTALLLWSVLLPVSLSTHLLLQRRAIARAMPTGSPT